MVSWCVCPDCHSSHCCLHLLTPDQLWDMIDGKELFQHIHNQQGYYDAKLHIAEMIALLGPPPPEIIQRYQSMKEYLWPQPVKREDGRVCKTAEEYFCGPFFDKNGIYHWISFSYLPILQMERTILKLTKNFILRPLPLQRPHTQPKTRRHSSLP